MENKDLSRDFAILFGIKPEEVPSDSSGNINQVIKWHKKQLEQNYPSYSEAIQRLAELSVEALKNSTKEGIKINKTNKQVFKEQVEELKKCSEMENSKADGVIDAMKGLARQSGLLPLESDKYNKAGNVSLTDENNIKHHPFPKSANKQTGEKETTKDKYIVTFKDGLTTIITKSMFDSLYDYAGKSNVNGYNIVSSLLFATDSDTGEMICLDSYSILSIVKCK